MSLIILVSIIPVIMLALFVYSKDNVKEPKPLLIELFISGFFAAALVIVIDICLSTIIPDFFITDNYNKISFYKLFSIVFLEIAFIEELSKWFMIKLLGYNNKNFDQRYDIIVYSVFVSLGFACIENIFYLVSSSITLGLYRAVFSIPAHACFGVFMGLFLGFAKEYEKEDNTLSKIYMFYAILIPALLHTTYNFCLLANQKWFFIVFLGFIMLLYTVAFMTIKRTSEENKTIDDNNIL